MVRGLVFKMEQYVCEESSAGPQEHFFAEWALFWRYPSWTRWRRRFRRKRPSGPLRLGFVYTPNGFIQDQWIPTAAGAGFELTPTLKPLAPVRDNLTVITRLAHLQANTFGDGVGRSSARFGGVAEREFTPGTGRSRAWRSSWARRPISWRRA